MRTLVAAAVLAGLGAAWPVPAQAAEDALWGNIAYPAKGNINLRAGTIEMWFRYDGDPAEKLARYHRFALFEFRSEDPLFSMGILVKGNDKTGPKISVAADLRGRDREGKPVEQFLGAPFDERQNEWHHVALGWDLDRMEAWLALDGVIHSKLVLNAGLWDAMGRASTSGLILLGQRGKYSPYSQATIDEFRISDDARPLQDLGAGRKAPLRLDPLTLLLDPLDDDLTPDGKRETKATFISGLSGEKGGTPSLHSAFVPGVFGNALRLHSPKEPKR